VDATAAARAVLQTGEFDFAWSTWVDKDVLRDMQLSPWDLDLWNLAYWYRET